MKGRTFAVVSLGNVIEWFDFGLFIYLAPIIGKYFFPSGKGFDPGLSAFEVFAAGFICRPLGGILFGHIGDRLGRAKSLTFSILAISISTAALGLLPAYSVLGWMAPVCFFLLRCIHGLSAGGEYTGAVIYLGEFAPVNKKGLLTSFAVAGANLGFFLATLILIFLNLFSSPVVKNIGWRFCFIGSGIFGWFIMYSRLKLQETSTFLELKASKKINERPFWYAVRYNPKIILQIFGLTCLGAPFYYMFFGFLPNFLAIHNHIAILKTLSAQAVFLLLMLLLLPVAGVAGDYFGRRKVLMITAIGMIFLSIPCFYLMQQNSLLLLFFGLGIATVLSSLEQANNLVTFVENCPAQIRSSGISFAYNTGNAIFGGTAPLMFSVLSEKIYPVASAYYLVLMACIGLWVIYTLKNNQTSINTQTSVIYPAQ
ncbi:MAG: MFS transporter [Proteobacteria bacterium]|nr:MFS transporter [Pseudomonadota bacterium]